MRNKEQSAGREREKGSYVGKLAFEMLREYPQASENVGLELRQEVSADTSLGVEGQMVISTRGERRRT